MLTQRQRHIQLFEHDSIRVGETRNGCVFTEKDWNLLLQLNERQYPPYLQPIHRGIRTLHYVGLIQLPGLCLEILPKTERAESSQSRNLFLQLLSRSGKIPQFNHLCTTEGNLADHFILQFLDETEKLCRAGLIKKYRCETANFSRFRGRMLVREQIRQNHVHKERVFAEYQAFDEKHLLHSLIRKALCRVGQMSQAQSVSERAKQLMAYFPDSISHNVQPSDWKRISLGRQDQHYAPVLHWARLILKKMTPALQSGEHFCSSFLFDMQALFEEWVSRELSAASKKQGHTLQLQPSRNFWRQRKIRPDMVLQTKAGETIILDTKWKILRNGQPDEADLKQMYIYNRFFQARRGILLYPKLDFSSTFRAVYDQQQSESMSCEAVFVDLLDRSNGQMNPAIGEQLLQEILGESIKSL